MRERREFPRAQVGGKKQHAFATGDGALEVFETFIHHGFTDVFARVLREQADFGHLAAERCEYSAQNFGALVWSLFRKREGQISFADAPQFSVQKVNQPGDRDPGRAGQRPGQHADQASAYSSR